MEKLPTQPEQPFGNNTSNTSNIGSNHSGNTGSNKWPDVEHALATKKREVENMGRDYIIEAPFKSVLTVGVAGLLLGFLLSKFRA